MFPPNGVQRFATGFEVCFLPFDGCVGDLAQINNDVGLCFIALKTYRMAFSDATEKTTYGSQSARGLQQDVRAAVYV